jgi:hypothetical protein
MRKDWSQILVCKLNADGYAENKVVTSGRSEIGTRDYEFEKRLENWGRCLNPAATESGAASTFGLNDFMRYVIQSGGVSFEAWVDRAENSHAAN